MIPSLTYEQRLNNCCLIMKHPLNCLEMDENATLLVKQGWLGWVWNSNTAHVQKLPASTTRLKKIKPAIVATIEAIRLEILKESPDAFFSVGSQTYSLRDVINKIDADPSLKFSTKVRKALTNAQTTYSKLPKEKPGAENSDVTDFLLLNETKV